MTLVYVLLENLIATNDAQILDQTEFQRNLEICKAISEAIGGWDLTLYTNKRRQITELSLTSLYTEFIESLKLNVEAYNG
jgi:hypothetical protein